MSQRREDTGGEGEGVVRWSELQLGSFSEAHKTSNSSLQK